MAKRRQTSLSETAAALKGARKAPLPDRVQPALAQSVALPPEGDNWLHEIKLDGYRMFCRKEGQTVRFLSRNNQDWTPRFRSLAKKAAALSAATVLLDGEMVVTLPDGRTSFQALQTALSDRNSTMIVFYAFDLLHLDGIDLTGVKLDDRKELLSRLLGESDPSRIVYCEHIVGQGPEVFEQAAQMKVEGIVSKRRDHPYRKGRTASWKKSKCLQTDEFVIGGYTAPSNAEYGVGAILVGQYDTQGRLIYAGRVGTGFSDATRRMLTEKLSARTLIDSPFVDLPPEEGGQGVTFVSPSLVVHV